MVRGDTLVRVDHELAVVLGAENENGGFACRGGKAWELVDGAEELHKEAVLWRVVEVAGHGADEGAVWALPYEARKASLETFFRLCK